MATMVDIANLALSHLGDTASVSGLYPPEGSAQAEHCARFYPIARDSLLEMHTWGFASRRMFPARLVDPPEQWRHAYGVPGDCLTVVAVLSAERDDGYAVGGDVMTAFREVDFVFESLADGTRVIYSDWPRVLLQYQARVEDTTAFSNLFTLALSWHLASLLAGPIIKGDVGAAEAKRCQQMLAVYLNMAREHDANQRDLAVNHTVPYIAGR